MKKAIIYLMLLCSFLVLASCGSGPKLINGISIEYYKNYDPKSGEVQGKLNTIPANSNIYVFLQSDKSFDKTSVSIYMSTLDNNKKTVVGGSSVNIKPEEKKVVIPLTIGSIGTYEISVNFNYSETPAATMIITVK